MNQMPPPAKTKGTVIPSEQLQESPCRFKKAKITFQHLILSTLADRPPETSPPTQLSQAQTRKNASKHG